MILYAYSYRPTSRFFDAMECELDINSVGSDPRSEQEKDAITSSVRINPD